MNGVLQKRDMYNTCKVHRFLFFLAAGFFVVQVTTAPEGTDL